MQDFIAALLPELSVDVAHDEIPVSEIEGEASRRTAPKPKPKPKSASKRKAASNGRTSKKS